MDRGGVHSWARGTVRKPPNSQIEHLDIDALRGGDFEERLFEPPRIGRTQGPSRSSSDDTPPPIGAPHGDSPPSIGNAGASDPAPSAGSGMPSVEGAPKTTQPKGLRARFAAAKAAVEKNDAAADPSEQGTARSKRKQRRDSDVDEAGRSPLPAPPSLDGALTDDNADKRLGFSLRMGLRERLRLRKATAEESPSDDPFAALVTPLSGYDLDQLRRELEADTVPVYDKVIGARRAESFSLRAGIIIGWMAVLSLALVWRDYFAALTDLEPPSWMQTPSWAQDLPMAEDYPQVAAYAIGALAPILLLLLSNSAGVELMRVITRPTARAVGSFLALAIIATVGVMMIISHEPLAAVATLVVGNFVGWVIGPWVRRERGVYGSTRR